MPSILQFTTSVAGLAFASVSLFGWGTIVRRVTRTSHDLWPVTIALGLCTVLMIGGLVNLARIAFAEILWSIAIAGFLFAVFHLMRSKFSPTAIIRLRPASITWIEAASVTIFIVLVIGFTIATQLPPDAFNVDDDLQKYFVFPVRQLQTGTLYGSPLSAIGSATLGGMSFLHSFVLSIASIQFINGVDAVFGLFLLMCIGAAVGWRRMTPLPGALLAPLLIVVINPQYANVSPLFLGAALMGTAVLLTADEREKYPPSTLAMGLVYSALVALKPTFALFVALHLPLAAIALSIVEGSVRVGVLWALRSAVFAVAGLAPWVILHLPHYLAITSRTDVVPEGAHDTINIFSGYVLAYGASFANYTILIVLALLVAVRSLSGLFQKESKSSLQRFSNLLAASITIMSAYSILLILSPIIGGYSTELRYSIPFLLGVVPFIIVISVRKLPSAPSWRNILDVPLAAYMIAVISFFPSVLQRYRQAIEYRSIIAFLSKLPVPAYVEYNRAALSAASAQTIQKLQNLIPPGEPFLAWTDQSYHLDFRRNPIIDVDTAGLTTNWARLPPSIQYVIWQYQLFGVPSPQGYAYWTHYPAWNVRLMAVRALSFSQFLSEELQKANIIYVDDQFVVARLSRK